MQSSSVHREDELRSVPSIRCRANSFSLWTTPARESRRKHCLLFFAPSYREKHVKREPPEALGLPWLFPKRSSKRTGGRSMPRAPVHDSAQYLLLNSPPSCRFVA